MILLQPKYRGDDACYRTLSKGVFHGKEALSDILDAIIPDNSDDRFISDDSNLISDARFLKTNEDCSAKDFDDSMWQHVNLPHDWSIYNEFNNSSPALFEGGYLDGGTAWYRFTLPALSPGSKAFLDFDGIYMESTVYINGHEVKKNYWYNPFNVDITQYLQDTNIVAVKVVNSQPSSRWYSGSGIIRPVTLHVGHGGYIKPSVKITTENNGHTVVTGELDSICTGSIGILVTDDRKQRIVEKITSIGGQQFNVDFSVHNPNLWNVNEGRYYTLNLFLVNSAGEIIYTHSEIYGYREFAFSPTAGLSINGNPVKLKGVCMHHDLGCLGAEVNINAVRRQVRILKDMGCNAIRLTHNPSSSIFVDVCAKEGILLVEEFFDCWTSAKKEKDFARFFSSQYADVVRTTVERDRNNPAVIMWSLGNEIIRTSSYTAEQAKGILSDIISAVRQYDDRPVTMGDDTPTSSVSQACMSLLDVIGINYGNDAEYAAVRALYPNKPIYGSETTSALSSRGVYTRDNANLQCSSYDNDYVSWGDAAATALRRHIQEYMSGMFVWTGFDYIGEPTPFNKFPAKSSYFGIVDLTGFPKDIYYMYQSRWTDVPMVHLLPHWNWEAGNSVKVWVYSNCPSVELFVNGVSKGMKNISQQGSNYQYEWNVPYAPGEVTAVGYGANGRELVRDSRYTAGNPSALRINREIIGNLCFAEVTAVDSEGNECPLADNSIDFCVIGGSIIAVDNGNASSVEPFRNVTERKAFNGKALCIAEITEKDNFIIDAQLKE